MNWTMIGIDYISGQWLAVGLAGDVDLFALYTLTTPNEPGAMWGHCRTRGTLEHCQKYAAEHPGLIVMVNAQYKAAKERTQKVS